MPTPDLSQLNELGTLFNAKRFREMEERASSLVEQFPESGAAWKALGTALQVQGKDAVAALREAANLLPNDSETFNNLAAALLDRNQATEAEAAARNALNIMSDFAEAHANFAKAVMIQGRFDEAVSHYRSAVKYKPGSPSMLCSLGIALNEQGDFDGATAAFDAAISLDPAMIEAHYGRAQLTTARPKEPYLGMLERQAGSAESMPLEIRLRFWFALGKICEDLGRYEQAFAAYREGNQLKHAHLDIDEAGADEMLARIMSVFTADFIEQRSAGGYRDKTPVFIVGMPRSGTTLIEQVLASAQGIHGGGELRDLDQIVKDALRSHSTQPFPDALLGLAPDALRNMGQQYVDRVRSRATEVRYVTDKMPANFFYAGLISVILPHAKIIHAMRDPMDTCFSCYARLFDGDKQAFAYDLGSLGRHYARYATLMKHWHAVLPAGAILDVRYEDMVRDTETEARRLFDYLELPWEDRCLDFHRNTRRVTTASAAQVRKPVYQTSMARWKHFKGHLAPLAELLDIHIDSPHVPATAIAPLKVAFISPFNLHDSSSGASQSIRTMLEQLAVRGASCHALTACCFDLGPGEKIAEQLRAKGLTPGGTIKEINMPVWQGRLRGVDYNAVQLGGQNRQQLSAVEEIFFRDTVRVWLAQNKPDIVLTYGGLLLDIEIQRCARAAGALVVFYLANPNYGRPETFAEVDLVLANSSATRQHYLQTMNIQSHSIGLFVDPQATLAAQHNPQFITFVNPTPEKGVALFLKLVLRAAEEAPDMRFLVVDSRNSFAAALEKFKISALALKSITLLSKQESMAQVYANTSVLLMPSFWFEGAGRILIEANANGIPVLAANRGGIPETLGGAGCLLPIPDRCTTDYWAMPDDDEVAPWWNELSRLSHEPAYRQEMSDRALAVAQTQSLSVKGATLDALLRGTLATRIKA